MNTQSAPASEAMDRINRQAWRRPDSVRWFGHLEGWTDPGERAAIERIADQARRQPILDIGVGGGRTVPILRAISSDYTAVDYTPELAAACREKYPDARILDGDARKLSAFADGSFALVVFSFNGIDAVNHEDRIKVLREAHRVLRSGGVFLFSSHNRNGPGHGERLRLGVYLTRNPFKLAWRVAVALARSPITLRNRMRYTRLNLQREGYSIMNAAAHNHGIVIYYVTLEQQRQQLLDAGFGRDIEVYGNLGGSPLAPGTDTSAQTWFHFIARKP